MGDDELFPGCVASVSFISGCPAAVSEERLCGGEGQSYRGCGIISFRHKQTRLALHTQQRVPLAHFLTQHSTAASSAFEWWGRIEKEEGRERDMQTEWERETKSDRLKWSIICLICMVQCLQKVFIPLDFLHILLCYKFGLKWIYFTFFLSTIYTKYSNVILEKTWCIYSFYSC